MAFHLVDLLELVAEAWQRAALPFCDCQVGTLVAAEGTGGAEF